MRVSIAYKFLYNGHLYVKVGLNWYIGHNGDLLKINESAVVLWGELESLLRSETLDV